MHSSLGAAPIVVGSSSANGLIDRLAAEQGVTPIDDPAELVADFWPADDSVDEFLAALRRWRSEGRGR